VKECSNHLFVTICLPESHFKLYFDVLIRDFLTNEQAQADDHVVESLLCSSYLHEIRVLNKVAGTGNQPLRCTLYMIMSEEMHQ
jgi:hypothetical protein